MYLSLFSSPPLDQFSRSDTGPTHRFLDSFQPQTPLGALTPIRTGFQGRRSPQVSRALKWAVDPVVSFQILLLPIGLFLVWHHVLGPHLAPQSENPFRPFLLISHRVLSSDPGDPRYERGYGDFAFIAYNVIFFSFVRQVITVNVSRRVGRYFGITREGKLDRFGEQGYAFVYFLFFGAWGLRIMSQLPTWWYRTENFWIGYPHWDMQPELKRYYLMQMAYWIQQFLVLVLGLEKPRKDYVELVAHHVVTLWLVIVSYTINLTLIGSAIYMSMDIPDMFLALSKLLNYIQWNRLNNFVLAAFVLTWTYFRHYLNLLILWSVWFEFRLISQENREWAPEKRTYLPWWMRHAAFVSIALLQLLNLFWYYLILRIAFKAIMTAKAEDDRSDDEDDGDDGDDDHDLVSEKEGPSAMNN
ncbi:longevity assurance proteins LAG1 LAC1 [Mycena rebaudengoi]|nr:longevity assurance proteins LAG1 LAC1 [Mycena rebaudengoi]